MREDNAKTLTCMREDNAAFQQTMHKDNAAFKQSVVTAIQQSVTAALNESSEKNDVK